MKAVAFVTLILACQAMAWTYEKGDDIMPLPDPNVPVDPNASAGLRITATQSGLNKFLQILIPLINQQFATIHLPDMKLEEHVPVIGHVTVEIHNIWIHNFNIPHGTVLTSAPDDIFFEIGPGVHLHLKADFHWRRHAWPHISGKGSVEATPDGGDIKVKIAITPGAGGHFHTHVDSASCNFHSFNIKFHGGAAWLINIFIRLLKEKIKKAIDDAVAKQIHTLIDKNLNEILAKIPTQYQVGQGSSAFLVNIPLVQSTANNNWFDMGFSFTVQNAKGGALCPAAIPDIPMVDTGATGRNIQIFMGQHFFQCALWVNYINGVLDFSIPSNTTDWLLWIPAIPLKWPNAGMTLRVQMPKLGTITISPGAITADIPLQMNITVNSGGAQHAATLGLNPTASIKLWVAKGAGGHPHLFLNVTNIKLTYSVIDTAVGPINLDGLQGLTNFIVPVIVKIIDDAIKNGFPIPVHKGLDLENDVIIENNGYLAVEADFAYHKMAEQPRVSPWVEEDPMTGDDVIHGV